MPLRSYNHLTEKSIIESISVASRGVKGQCAARRKSQNVALGNSLSWQPNCPKNHPEQLLCSHLWPARRRSKVTTIFKWNVSLRTGIVCARWNALNREKWSMRRIHFSLMSDRSVSWPQIFTVCYSLLSFHSNAPRYAVYEAHPIN